MLEINDSVDDADGVLRVTLVSFEPRRGKGSVKIDVLKAEQGRFYVTVKYGAGGQMRIDYKTYDLNKTSEYSFRANPDDVVTSIELVRTTAD